MAESFRDETRCSQAEPPFAAEAPIDAAIAARETGDMAAELLFEGRRPGHELETEAVIDHREAAGGENDARSEEHTSELQSLMRISYVVFCLEKKKTNVTYQLKQLIKH